MIPRIPLWFWSIVIGLWIAATMFYVVVKRHEYRQQGRDEVQAKWDKSTERGRKALRKLEEKASKVSVRTETKYVDRVQVIREKGETIQTVREVFVPVDSGSLGAGFRVFHDAAAANLVPDPAAIIDAAPAPVADVAATVAANYERCHLAYATVTAWQQWATEQCKLNDKGCYDGG